ncbi:MAG: hypothetical protein KDD58_06270 [Bdellovibrionales bacterium]|nr:hypothetical protein [Bdellovibrionales bacterium]
MNEPHTLDPLNIRGSAGSYFFSNIYRSLYRYDNEKGLIPEGAQACHWKNKKLLVCYLNPNIKWSNGENITSTHYLNAFKRFFTQKTSTTETESLLNIKNAKKILSGKTSADTLGIKTPNNHTLEFYFDELDLDFKYKLSFPSLAPIYSDQFPDRKQASKLIVNGPYTIDKWDIGKHIILKRNPYYPNKYSSYPSVLIHIIDSDDAAMRVYEAGDMSFLRRLTTDHILVYKTKKGFFHNPVARFDYLGFGPELRENKELRQALVKSLDYEKLKNVLHALGRPGCPSLPSRLMDKTFCHNFNLMEAKINLSNVNKDLKNKRWKIYFSKLGGEDIAKSMEWIQFQWKSHLNLTMDLEPVEQGVYLYQLKTKPPAIFRKGLGLDRPTCLSGLEIFLPNHPENFIRLNNKNYNSIVEQLKNSLNISKQKKLCTKAIKILIDEAYIIPLGEIHFSMLENGKYKGWKVNELNQLDLTDLQLK